MTLFDRALRFHHAELGYVDNRLDRLANAREHESTIPALLADPSARAVAFSGNRVLVRSSGNGSDPLFSMADLEVLGVPTELVFLGRDDEGGLFAVRFDPPAEDYKESPPTDDLRNMAIAGHADSSLLGVLAEAKALLHWHHSHQFCAACGHPSAMAAWGWRRECPQCGTHHFPRTDPVVIMLAVDGERCLLGRQPRFPPGMYSCLAGFLEPGETIEAAVRRELQEEAGIETREVRYLASQPWPFPASIMIGCLVETTKPDVVIDHVELEDARWFTRDEVVAMLAGSHEGGLRCPPPMAIAHGLMRAWADA